MPVNLPDREFKAVSMAVPIEEVLIDKEWWYQTVQLIIILNILLTFTDIVKRMILKERDNLCEIDFYLERYPV